VINHERYKYGTDERRAYNAMKKAEQRARERAAKARTGNDDVVKLKAKIGGWFKRRDGRSGVLGRRKR